MIVKSDDFCSDNRQNRIFQNIPKRVAKALLRVVFHLVIHFAPILFTDFAREVLHNGYTHHQLLWQRLWSKLFSKIHKVLLANTLTYKSIPYYHKDA